MARDSSSTNNEDAGYNVFNSANMLESQGRVNEALAVYEKIVQTYPGTAAAGDAQKSIESLRRQAGSNEATEK